MTTEIRDVRAPKMKEARRHDAGGGVVVLFVDPEFVVRDAPWIEHQCIAGDDTPILTAVSLHPGHSVSDDHLTVSPSILCQSCGLHGFLTDGKWRSC